MASGLMLEKADGIYCLSNLMDKGKRLADELSNEESIDYSSNKEVPDEFPNLEDESDVSKSSSTVRGPTKNSGRMRMSGGKLVVRYNGLGVPIGPEATELASFIGLLGRTSIPDINQEWRKVTLDLKSHVWEFIKCSETGLVETEFDRSVAWEHARKMTNG
ncbi:hypothetical protein CISIN_1g043306mg [Citrus sinensis]|uniref:Uncharacterized protein n=1 Tax=Citrus sinensis TaxID=2711 RepID=A0A067DHE3_CITSI|nr:hypothetical protein CISIN_1g043306mg [Citrus sinensis]